MATQERDLDEKIEGHLEAGFGALERGDVKAAKKSANAALALDDSVAEAHTLLGGAAEREGDVAAARKAYLAARKADPAAFEPVLALAEIEHAEGDAQKARKLFAEAVEVAEEEEEFVEAVLASAEFELAEGGVDAARAVLAELPPVDLPAPNDHLRAGDLLRQLGTLLSGAEAKAALGDAERHFSAAGTQADGDASITADARYGTALVAEARGETSAMTKAFAEVHALDTKEERPPWGLSDQRMEELVEEVLEELPERARTLLANVPIVIEARPSRAQVQEGMDPRLLGLFAGPSLVEASDAPSLQQITLFTRNLERAAANVEDLEEEIRVTLLHETGHFFGLDEEALADLGLD